MLKNVRNYINRKAQEIGNRFYDGLGDKLIQPVSFGKGLEGKVSRMGFGRKIAYTLAGAVMLAMPFVCCGDGGEEKLPVRDEIVDTENPGNDDGDDDSVQYLNDDTQEGDDDSVYENTTTSTTVPTTTGQGSTSTTGGDCVIPFSGMIINENTLLCNGTYNIPSDEMNKGAIVFGGDGITLDCNNATLIGNFTCEGVNGSMHGISLRGVNDAEIRNCNLHHYCAGITVEQGASNVRIIDNYFEENGTPGYGDNIQLLDVDHLTIEDNLIQGGSNEGIYSNQGGENMTIRNNQIYAVQANGVICAGGCDNLLIEGNIIGSVLGDGIDISSSDGVSIKNNRIDSINNNGIILEEVSNSQISGNILTGSGHYQHLLKINNGSSLLVWNNYFEKSTGNLLVSDNGQNSWNISLDCTLENIVNGRCTGGNYYSNLSGVDNNGDEIFDSPYNLSGGSSVDNYPLVLITSPLNKK